MKDNKENKKWSEKKVTGIVIGLMLLNFLVFLYTRSVQQVFMIILSIWVLVTYKKGLLYEKYNMPIENGEIISAKVILVDNSRTPKKLVCQTEGEKIVQYQIEKYDNFLERFGDMVEVEIDVIDEKRYRVLVKEQDNTISQLTDQNCKKKLEFLTINRFFN